MNAPNQLADMKSPAPREANIPSVAPGFGSLQSFELAMRQAKLLSSSTLVPAQYRQIVEKKKGRDVIWEENANAVPNCVIAMNMAQRMNADPLMVMQNLYIVEGRPSWSSIWIISAINTCGRFMPLRYELTDLGQQEVEYTVTEWIDNQKTNKKVKVTIKNSNCVAWTVERGVDIPKFSLDEMRKYKSIYRCCKEYGVPLVESPTVSIDMAVNEGWYQKNGSKWQTMPEVMLRYRTASFFGKLYAPELLMGLPSSEEVFDTSGVIDAQQSADGSFTVDVASLKTQAESIDKSTGEILETMQDDGGSRAGMDPDDQALKQVEQTKPAGGFNPTAEEIAAIREREMAEANPTRQRRERGQMSIE